MILLLGLMLFGTITIINLLVGVVISDVNKLQKDVLKRVWEKIKNILLQLAIGFLESNWYGQILSSGRDDSAKIPC